MERKLVESMTVLYAAQELTIPEVGIYGERYGSEIMEEVGKHGLRVVGPWVFVSYHIPKNGKDRYRMEFCLPIATGNSYVAGKFSIKSLGSFSCVCTEHIGKLRQIFTKGYQPLVRAVVAAGLNFSGESREVYHSWNGPNSPENRIEIQLGVV